MIKLRCLAVTDASKFWPGDVVNVVGFGSKDGNKTGGMKVRNIDTIAAGKFTFRGKDLYFDFSKWRVLMIPKTEAV